jgi:hypothetical protein
VAREQALGEGDRQGGCGGVLGGQERLDVLRPGDPDLGIQRVHAVLSGGIVHLVAQVHHDRVVGERQERVPEPFGQVHGVAIDVVQPDGVPGAERGGADPQIHYDVEDRPGHAGDVLGLAGRNVGEVDPAHGAPSRHRAVRLRQPQRMPDRLRERLVPVPLQEGSPVVGELPGGQDVGVRHAQRCDLHGISLHIGRR